MVILIVTPVKVGDKYFIPGQEYLYQSTGMITQDCESCTPPISKSQLGFSTIVDGRSIIIPSEHSTLIKKDTPDEDMSGYMAQHVKAATDDYVVMDGDYTKAVMDRFGISIAPKPRPDQADYDQDRIRAALALNRNLLKRELIPFPVIQGQPPYQGQGIGYMKIGSTFIIGGSALTKGIGFMKISTTFKIG